MSFPNQHVLYICKSNIEPPFLQISSVDWIEAFQTLTRSAFGIYLLLSQNQHGYCYEYSPTYIAKIMNMNKSTATKAWQELEEKGYIEENKFYTSSKARREGMARIQKEVENRCGQS